MDFVLIVIIYFANGPVISETYYHDKAACQAVKETITKVALHEVVADCLPTRTK
jgi:hypothetical protein